MKVVGYELGGCSSWFVGDRLSVNHDNNYLPTSRDGMG